MPRGHLQAEQAQLPALPLTAGAPALAIPPALHWPYCSMSLSFLYMGAQGWTRDFIVGYNGVNFSVEGLLMIPKFPCSEIGHEHSVVSLQRTQRVTLCTNFPRKGTQGL